MTAEKKKHPRPLVEEVIDPPKTAHPAETELLRAKLREQLEPVREEMRKFREEVRQCQEAVVSIRNGFRE